jgi:hypothetical protein
MANSQDVAAIQAQIAALQAQLQEILAQPAPKPEVEGGQDDIELTHGLLTRLEGKPRADQWLRQVEASMPEAVEQALAGGSDFDAAKEEGGDNIESTHSLLARIGGKPLADQWLRQVDAAKEEGGDNIESTHSLLARIGGKPLADQWLRQVDAAKEEAGTEASMPEAVEQASADRDAIPTGYGPETFEEAGARAAKEEKAKAPLDVARQAEAKKMEQAEKEAGTAKHTTRVGRDLRRQKKQEKELSAREKERMQAPDPMEGEYEAQMAEEEDAPDDEALLLFDVVHGKGSFDPNSSMDLGKLAEIKKNLIRDEYKGLTPEQFALKMYREAA